MNRFFTAACIVAGLTVVAWADSPTPQTTPPPPKGRIAQRKGNQQARIAQGVSSGQLTAGETARIEKKESKLNREIRRDRVANGGNLTNNQKRQVNRQQNRLSRKIYKEKHDAQTQK